MEIELRDLSSKKYSSESEEQKQESEENKGAKKQYIDYFPHVKAPWELREQEEQEKKD